MKRRSSRTPDRRARGRVPLERALSKLGIASRTEARLLILAGRVRIGASVARDPLGLIVPETAKIFLDDKPIEIQQTFTLAFHKPRGVVTTRSDEMGRPTVYAALGDIGARVIPVGRLDLATTGLLLLTNDTRFAAWVTDPENAVPRVYLASVRGELRDDTAERLRAGIRDGGETLAASALTIRKRSGRETHLVIELVEGKNREIRRMLAAVGHEVTRLKRVSFGGIELGDLPLGKWRELSTKELEKAFPGAPLSARRAKRST